MASLTRLALMLVLIYLVKTEADADAAADPEAAADPAADPEADPAACCRRVRVFS